MDKSQVRSCINETFPIGYNPLTGNVFIDTTGSTNGQVLTSSGGTVIWANTSGGSTTLIVGTTPITSGTVGRVLFEGAGNVLQENAILNLDTTNGLIIGGTTARGTRLTAINAADTLASKTLVVRNAADSADRFSVNGNGSWSLTASTGNSMHAFDSGFAGSGYYIGTSSTVSTGNSYLQILPGTLNFMPAGATPAATTAFKMQGSNNFLEINNYGNGLRITHGAWTGSWQLYALSGNFGITTGSLGTGTNRGVLFIENGTAPTANLTNIMQIYSQNITNASFHVRDSNDRVFYAGEKTGMRSNHNLQLAANNTVYAVLSTAGRMYVGGSTTPTAVMHLAAGTATASTAPIKLTSGTLLTAPEVGTIEFLTDRLTFTGTTGTTRKDISQLVYRGISALYTLDGSDELVNCTTGTFAVTLPTAVGFTGQYIIKNSGTGVITLNTTSSQTIDGVASGLQTLNQYDAITLRSDGANWIII